MEESEWKSGDPERRQINANSDLGWLKKMAIGSLIGLLVHFAAGIWWAATLTSKVDFMQEMMNKTESNLKEKIEPLYSQADSVKDFALINSRLDAYELRLSRLENLRK